MNTLVIVFQTDHGVWANVSRVQSRTHHRGWVYLVQSREMSITSTHLSLFIINDTYHYDYMSETRITPMWVTHVVNMENICDTGGHFWDYWHGPLARYVKLGFAHAPGMRGTFFPPPGVSDPDMHHGTCVTHVPWCMSGSLTSGFIWSRWRGKRSRHSRRMRNPQFKVSGKRPITSSRCNSVDDGVSLDAIYWYAIFKWVLEAWIHGRISG